MYISLLIFKYFVFLTLLTNTFLTAYSAYYFTKYHPEYLTCKAEILMVCKIIFGILLFSRIGIYIYHTKKKVDAHERAALNGAIGYGLLFLCGFAPQAWIFVEKKNSEEIVYLYSCVFVFNATASMVAFLYIFPHCATNFQFERTEGAGSGIVLALMFHLSVAGLMLCLPNFVFGFLLGGYETRVFLHVMLIIWYYPLMFWPCSMEFLIYLMAYIEKEGEKPAKQLPEATKDEIFETRVCEPNCLCGIVPQPPTSRAVEIVSVVMEEEEIPMIPHTTGLECDVCLLEYSTQLLPRILVGCGHTMCHACVEKLLEIGGSNMICPFCRITTRVPAGLPSQLPKNFALLAMVQDRNV